jgi:hypothetical protein
VYLKIAVPGISEPLPHSPSKLVSSDQLAEKNSSALAVVSAESV